MNDDWIDGFNIPRLQVETSMSSGFDFDEPNRIQVENDDDPRKPTDDNGNSFEILELISSPVVLRPIWKRFDDVEQYTKPYVPPTTEDLLDIDPNKASEKRSDEMSYASASNVIKQSSDEGRMQLSEIHQLEGSPVVLRPKKQMRHASEITDNQSTIIPTSVTTTDEKILGCSVDDQLPLVDEMPNGVDDGKMGLTSTGDNDKEDANGSNNSGGNDVFDVTDFRSDLVKTHKIKVVTASTSSVNNAPAPRRASFLGASYVNRVQELARLMEEATTTVSTGNATTTAARRFSTLRGVRRKDEQRTSYVDQDDFRLTENERRWVICSASSDYQAMSKQLNDSPSLANRRDPVTGLTALHWAAKNGRPDVVKLLVTDLLMVNCRTRDAGYTPLHLAASHGRHDVIELLVVVYRADRDAADFSGRLPLQHLMQRKNATTISQGYESTSSSNWLRSEALLKPSKKFIVAVELDVPPSPDMSVGRRSSIWTSLTGYGVPTTSGGGGGGAIGRRDSMPIVRQNLAADAITSSRPSSDVGSMLPPRQLPTVNRRQSVTTTKMRMVSSAHDMLSLPKISENVSLSDNDEPSSGRRKQT